MVYRTDKAHEYTGELIPQQTDLIQFLMFWWLKKDVRILCSSLPGKMPVNILHDIFMHRMHNLSWYGDCFGQIKRFTKLDIIGNNTNQLFWLIVVFLQKLSSKTSSPPYHIQYKQILFSFQPHFSISSMAVFLDNALPLSLHKTKLKHLILG